MELARLFTRCMLTPKDLRPSDPAVRVVGVLNPGVSEVGGRTAILARVVEQPLEQRSGMLPSPRYGDNQRLVIDWLAAEDCDLSDPRLYVSKKTGLVRLRFVSHLRLFWSDDGQTICKDDPGQVTILPEDGYETYGIEDPRITTIDGMHTITYVGVSPRGVCTMLMSTTDFVHFKRHGVIFCPDNKDVVLFPERILGQYIAMHRPMPSMRFMPPQVWLARSSDLISWGGHQQLAGLDSSGNSRDRVGGGTPPVKTRAGWLTIYHGSDKQPDQDGAGTYTAGALLLDLDNPAKIVGKSDGPIMIPREDFEREGFVNNVIFPTAVIERGDELHVYYGAADQCIGVCGFKTAELIELCRSGQGPSIQ